MTSTYFGSVLRSLREGAGLSQKALADKAGLSQKAISFWEMGVHDPNWSAVVALCDVFEVSADVFRPAKDQPEPVIPAPRRGRPAKQPTPEPTANAAKRASPSRRKTSKR